MDTFIVLNDEDLKGMVKMLEFGVGTTEAREVALKIWKQLPTHVKPIARTICGCAYCRSLLSRYLYPAKP